MGHLIKHTGHLLKLIIFLSIGSLMASLMACDNQSDSQYAFITASVEGTETDAPVTKTIVNRQGKNHLPPEVTRIEFDITDSEGVNNTAVLNIGPETQTINFRVFANRDLVIRVDVYSGDTLSFQGQSPVAALRPGQTFPFSIEADPVGGTPPVPPEPVPQPLSTGFQSVDRLFDPTVFGAYTEDVAIDGNFAYLASRDSGLIIADISDRNNIRAVAAIEPFDPTGRRRITDVLIQADPVDESGRNYAYTINGDELSVIDVSNPLLPVAVSSLAFSETAGDLTISGNLAYVRGVPNSTNVFIIDISNPANLSQVGIFQASGRITDISVSGQTLYVRSRGVQIVDVSDPANPAEIALLQVEVSQSSVIYADNTTLYVENTLPGNSLAAVDIVDVSDINNMTVLSTITSRISDIQGLYVVNNNLYISGSSLSVYDTRDKSIPVLIGEVQDIAFTGNIDVADAIYIPATNRGLKVVEFSDLSTLVPSINYDASGGFASSISIQNNFAYISVVDFNNTANSGLHIVDISDTTNPQRVNIVPIERPSTVETAGNFAYVIDNGANQRNLSIIDITVPTSSSIRSVLALQRGGADMLIQNNRLFISSGEVIDISNPDSPSTFTNLNVATATINNDILTTTGMSFFDISDINSPLRISSYASNSSANSFIINSTAVAGNFAYIAGNNFNSNSGNSQFNILDISAITNPTNIAAPSIISDINNSIEAPGVEGSVRHHTFTLTNPITLGFEIGSENFIPVIYLFQDTSAGLEQLAVGGRDGINNITLPAGNYDLAIGSRGLSTTDAQGTINTNTTEITNNSGSYALHIAPAARLVGETPIPGNISAITIKGNFAYLRENNQWLYVVDISDVANPYITARFKHGGGGGPVTLEGDNMFISDNLEGIKIYKSAMDLQITSQTQTSTTVDFNLSWSIDRVGPGAQFNCGVVVGDCTVTSVDFAARTASVSWTPSVFSGDYGIVFALGNEQSTIGTRTNIDWITGQGENPEPERILLNSFIGAIQPNLSPRSIAYFDLLSDKRQNIRIEVSSASFNTHLYILNPSVFLNGSGDFVFVDNDDFNDSLLSSIDTSVFAGEYALGIGNSILSVTDAISRDDINTSTTSGDTGNGLFEIKVYELRGNELIEPGLPARFNQI